MCINLKNRITLFGIIIVLMLLIPSVSAASDLKSVGLESQNIGEGKADLIIEKIVWEWSDTIPYVKDMSLVVRNIGDATVTEKIWIEVLLRYYILGFIPSHITYHYHGTSTPSGGLEPGETVKIHFGDDNFILLVGWFRFECEVNPNHEIDEWDYGNNYYNAKYFKIFHWWILI